MKELEFVMVLVFLVVWIVVGRAMDELPKRIRNKVLIGHLVLLGCWLWAVVL